MTLQEYLKLRNGTDVRGVAMDGVADEPITLTEEAAENVAKAFCVWLITHTGKTQVSVAVGYDSRLTSPALCEAAVRGITSTGHTAVVTGLSTTPSMVALLKDLERMNERYCHGSIMITASHLPFNRNGLKFFSHNGGLEASDVKEILELAATYRFAETTNAGERIEAPYLDTYAASLVEKVRVATGEETPLAGKKIVPRAFKVTQIVFAVNVIADTVFDYAQRTHFFLNIVKRGTRAVAGMHGMDMQILPDFHNVHPLLIWHISIIYSCLLQNQYRMPFFIAGKSL